MPWGWYLSPKYNTRNAPHRLLIRNSGFLLTTKINQKKVRPSNFHSIWQWYSYQGCGWHHNLSACRLTTGTTLSRVSIVIDRSMIEQIIRVMKDFEQEEHMIEWAIKGIDHDWVINCDRSWRIVWDRWLLSTSLVYYPSHFYVSEHDCTIDLYF